MNPEFAPPEAVLSVMGHLLENGHDAWLVGGCVRDLLLERPPADWDVCTSARPDAVLSLFPGSLDTGARHGTVTVLTSGKDRDRRRLPVEVTTWRSESGYSDHRHPDVVRFSDSLETDLSRRDFTINAMAWQPENGLVDLFGGQADLAGRLVRCVGDPLARFREDALRMLRAVRFCSQLGFTLDGDAVKAIRHHREEIVHVSRERIQHALNRTLGGRCPSSASLWWETGLHRFLFELPGLPAPENPGESLTVLDKPDIRNLATDSATEPNPEGGNPEGENPEGEIPEGVIPEGAISEGAIPEGTNPEGTNPEGEILPWALFWIATGLSHHEKALDNWMRDNRFPKHRAMAIRKMLRIHAAHLPPTPRNLRFIALTEGREWVERVLKLEAFASGQSSRVPSVPDVSKPAVDVNQLRKLFCAQGRPIGRNLGDLLACLGLAICECPEINRPDLLEAMAARMISALPG